MEELFSKEVVVNAILRSTTQKHFLQILRSKPHTKWIWRVSTDDSGELYPRLDKMYRTIKAYPKGVNTWVKRTLEFPEITNLADLVEMDSFIVQDNRKSYQKPKDHVYVRTNNADIQATKAAFKMSDMHIDYRENYKFINDGKSPHFSVAYVKPNRFLRSFAETSLTTNDFSIEIIGSGWERMFEKCLVKIQSTDFISDRNLCLIDNIGLGHEPIKAKFIIK